MATSPALYYDPYDFEIDNDPYPVWRRLREEAPLYYNEQHDFYALSRFEDVEQGLIDWERSARAAGTCSRSSRRTSSCRRDILFEDPPIHDVHRGRCRGSSRRRR